MIIDEIQGHVFHKVEEGRFDYDHRQQQAIIFHRKDGKIVFMTHFQDCCEHVYVEDINGDLNDLVDTEILSAREEVVRDEAELGYESLTATFYHLRTEKGDVTIRWHGESNGYYSESVDIIVRDEGELE
jgi:hypothetical protein